MNGNPVCVKCEVEMRPVELGVSVEEHRSGGGPYKIWSADLKRCPSCGIEVLTGFGAEPMAEHYQPQYATYAKRVAYHVR